MEFTEKDMLLIEDYLDGKLSDESREAFEKRLKSDPDFAKAVELRNKMPGLMREASDLEATRDEVRSAIQQQKQTTLRLKSYWWFAAASVIILVGIFLVIRFTNQKAGPGIQVAKEENQETLKTDKPTNYAKLGELVNEIEIISPIEFKEIEKGNEVILKWKSSTSAKAIVFVKRIDEQDVLFESEIFLPDEEYVLEAVLLEEGIYNWYINDTTVKGSFSVILNK